MMLPEGVTFEFVFRLRLLTAARRTHAEGTPAWMRARAGTLTLRLSTGDIGASSISTSKEGRGGAGAGASAGEACSVVGAAAKFMTANFGGTVPNENCERGICEKRP